MKISSRTRQMLVAFGLAILLVLVFVGYLQPEFIVDLANRYVFC